MSIARNLFIGREPTLFSVFGVGILDQKKMGSESIKAIANVDLHLRSPDALVGELSGGQRQGVAIARAMKKKGQGRIVNFCSVTLNGRWDGYVPYVASKGAMAAFQ